MAYELDFLPVGENTKSGDAITFRFWNNSETEDDQRVCIVDGGYVENGEKIKEHIQKYYKTNKVDLVISTHPDNDHIGGLKHILNNMEVSELWIHRPWLLTNGLSDCFKDGRITDNSLAERIKDSLQSAYDLEQIAITKGIKIRDPYTGVGAFDGAVQVVGPNEDYYKDLLLKFRCTPEAAVESASFMEKAKAFLKKIFESWDKDSLEENPETSAENNSSVITLLKFDNKYYLLTADAGVSSLEKCAEQIEQLGLSYSDICYIQVPHHGSKHNVNTQVLNKLVGPVLGENEPIKGGCVSVCKECNSKHPSKAVLNAFKRRGVNITKTAGSSLCKHSSDIPIRDGYTTAKSYEFFEEYEVEV